MTPPPAARNGRPGARTAFASDIGAELVAEGIETEDGRQALLAIGAGYGQGHLLGRPQAAAGALQAASTPSSW